MDKSLLAVRAYILWLGEDVAKSARQPSLHSWHTAPPRTRDRACRSARSRAGRGSAAIAWGTSKLLEGKMHHCPGPAASVVANWGGGRGRLSQIASKSCP